MLRLGPAGASQNLGGGSGGGGGGSLTGTKLLFLSGEWFFSPIRSEFLEDDEEKHGDDDTGIGGGRDGAEKLITKSGDFDFKLLGLKFNAGETV